MRHKLLIAALLSVAASCAPKLGDSCGNSIECSAGGDRLCDKAQPGGYCTIQNCEPGDCGDEGVCVRFNPTSARRASSWCMAKCERTRDCDRDEYVCRSAAELNARTDEGDAGTAVATGADIVEVLEDRKSTKFCVVRE